MPRSPFEALSRQRLEIEVPEQRPLLVERWDGQRPGPNVIITAGMHGNEINGPALLHKAKVELKETDFNGTIYFAPVLNITGFRKNERCFQPFNEDLNRVFPGSPVGRPAAARAHVFFTELMQYCDAGVDLHDAGDRNILLPHVRVHRGPNGEPPDPKTLALARLAGADIIFERPGFEGMLAVEAMRRLQRTVLTIEVGGGDVLWPQYLKTGVTLIKNVLKALKMISGDIQLPRYQFLLEERQNYLAPFEGLIQLNVPLGQAVHTGQVLAEIFDPIDGQTAQVVSKECGILFDVKLVGRATRREHIASVLQFGTCPSHPNTKPNINPERILINDPGPGLKIKTNGSLDLAIPLIIQKDHDALNV